MYQDIVKTQTAVVHTAFKVFYHDVDVFNIFFFSPLCVFKEQLEM